MPALSVVRAMSESKARRSPFGVPIAGVAVVLLGAAIASAAVLDLNSGHFTYNLDDAYIHLALAEQIQAGHYGINAAEPSAPSSSILWPFLLAPFAATRFAALIPFLINLLVAAACVVVFHGILDRSLIPVLRGSRGPVACVVLILLVIGTNVIGLIFTGMEHGLQVLLGAVVLLGMIREVEDRRVPAWLPVAIAAGPLVRYESLAISAGAVSFLALRGHRRAALSTGVATVLPLVAFSLFLASLGLGLLPASVLMKAPTLGGGVDSMLGGLAQNLRAPAGIVFALGVALFGWLALRPSGASGERLLAGVLALALGLHLLAGRCGWHWRYEAYLMAFASLGMLHLFRDSVARFIHERPAAVVALVGLLGCFAIGGRHMTALATLPRVSNNIYAQHYQMHRFAVDDYRAPAAVNDVGYVSFQNENYVLDLWGLGSPEARLRARETDPRWMNEVAARHGVELAMVHKDWFEALPPNWREIGELRLTRGWIEPALETVCFYALNDSAYAKGRAAADAFRKALPAGVVFTVRP